MLIDDYSRKIDYLRISITDRCNLKCIYCMPSYGIVNKAHQELLSFEEIVEIVKVAVPLGIDKIRLTGGEPLVRKDLINLINLLSNIEGIKDISMTTNGIFLKEYAFDLKKAGLKRVNISLDSLRQARYKFITRQDRLEDVLQGIRKSQEVGLLPLKINCLLLDDIGVGELADFFRLTMENPVCVRFLEFMPINSFYRPEKFISSSVVLEIAKRFCKIEEVEILGNGPAKTYRFKHALGSFGIISPISNKFCASCNRLRLTSDGFLKLCLHSDLKVNLRDPLRNGADREALIELFKLAIDLKPKEHSLDHESPSIDEFSMCQIGG